jgi:hypothetical protein
MKENQLVFISHSTNDDKIAKELCDYLEKNSLKCWIAPRNNSTGKLYGASIIEGINNSRIMIVILSKYSNHSDSVINEVERAHDKKRDIITFKIDKTVISSELEFFLSSRQWLDASNGNSKTYFPEVLKTCVGLLNDSTTGIGTESAIRPKQEKTKLEIFVNGNKIILTFSVILGFGFLVFNSVLQDRHAIKNYPNSGPIVKDSFEDKFKNKSNSEPAKKVQNEPKVIVPTKINNGKKEPVSSAELEKNDLDNVMFDNPQNNDYVKFHIIKKGVYNFNGQISKYPFSGTIKFISGTTYEIVASKTVRGGFYINNNELTGSLTLLENDYTPTDFLLYRN